MQVPFLAEGVSERGPGISSLWMRSPRQCLEPLEPVYVSARMGSWAEGAGTGGAALGEDWGGEDGGVATGPMYPSSMVVGLAFKVFENPIIPSSWF